MNWLFDYQNFTARSMCGIGWTESLVILNMISNFLIFLSYTTIPFSLFILWKKRRKDIPNPYIIVMFMHFIFLCGITHLNNVIAFKYPAYRYFTLIDFLTATFSSLTAVFLPKVVTYISTLPSFEEIQYLNLLLQTKNQENNQLINNFREHNDKLIQEVLDLEQQLQGAKWIESRYDALDNLKRMLKETNVN